MGKRDVTDGAGAVQTTGGDEGPSERLAALVVRALVADGVVSTEDGEKVRAKLAAGKLDGSGWRLIFENQIERAEAERAPK